MARTENEVIDARAKFIQLMADCMDKPSVFADTFLKLKLFPKNTEYADCKERYIVYRSGRQVGKTTTTAVKAIHFALFAPALHEMVTETGVCDIVIIAPTKDQSNIMLERIKALLAKSEFLMNHVEKSIYGEVDIKWMNGKGKSRIYTRAAGEKGTSTRGYSPTVIIADECSFLPENVIIALMPSGMATKARVWLTSTPYTPVGYFYNACRDSRPRNPKGSWIEFHCKSTDNPLIANDPEYIATVTRNMTEAQKRMEVDGEFLDVGDSFIPRHLIEEAMNPPEQPAVLIKYVIGVDVATEGLDETCICVIGIDREDKAHLVEVYTERRSDLVVLANVIEQKILKYNAVLAYIDETAVGKGLIDICNHQNMRVQGVVMSLEEQERMYKNLLMMFENRRIFLYGNNKMAEQLTYLKTKWTEGKKMRITSDLPDDCADGLTLACRYLDSGDRMFVLTDKAKYFF